jgi:hypothetical protein
MRGARWAALAGAVLCFILAFSFTYEFRSTAETSHAHVQVGVWFSPWFTLDQDRHTAVRGEGGGFTGASSSFNERVNWLSGSWLVLLAGVLLLHGYRRLSPPGRSSRSSPEPAGD